MSAQHSIISGLPGGEGLQSDRLLILEDSDEIAEILRELANSSGYQVYRANDRDQAIADCAKLRPGLVLLNLGYAAATLATSGEERGLKFLRSLAAQQIRSRIIIVSANPESVREAFVGEGLSMGLSMVGHFGKPFDVDELQQKLLELRLAVPG